MKHLTLSLAVLALVACASLASAQTVVVNPTTVEFTASTDHNALGLDGVALISRYDLRIYIEAGMTLVTTIALGKPSPLAGQIVVTNAAWFSPLQPNTRMVARVVAVGPTWEAASNISNPFGTAGPPAAPTVPIVRR
jgi:hypothetical protein